MTYHVHTPGPWAADEAAAVYADSGELVADCFSRAGWNDADANARLIAAAPEMFAALKAICDGNITYVGNEIRIACSNYFQAMDRISNARAAIAKATGGQS